jgi:hypothetical protein
MKEKREMFLWGMAGLASFLTFYASAFLTWKAWDAYRLTWRILEQPLGPVILVGFLALVCIFWFIMSIVYWARM